ncbi:MAG TPA: hypothetical protein DCY51_08315 [Bacteroidetes bacterium]|nr:hypothetical protein [Bacteroidota bacterium]
MSKDNRRIVKTGDGREMIIGDSLNKEGDRNLLETKGIIAMGLVEALRLMVETQPNDTKLGRQIRATMTEINELDKLG